MKLSENLKIFKLLSIIWKNQPNKFLSIHALNYACLHSVIFLWNFFFVFLFGFVAILYFFQFFLGIMSDLFQIFLLAIFWAFLSVYFKAVNLWDERWLKRFWNNVWIDLNDKFRYHEENIGEWTAKVGAVNIVTFFLRHIDFLAPWTVYLDSWGSDFLTHSDWKDMLPFAKDSGTYSKYSFGILLLH